MGNGEGREADHSPPSSAEFKNTWSYTFTPPIFSNEYVFLVWYLVKHRDDFTFIFICACGYIRMSELYRLDIVKFLDVTHSMVQDII
jgi:hypothetical protein